MTSIIIPTTTGTTMAIIRFVEEFPLFPASNEIHHSDSIRLMLKDGKLSRHVPLSNGTVEIIDKDEARKFYQDWEA